VLDALARGNELPLSVRMRVAFQVRGAADQIVEAANVRVARVLKRWARAAALELLAPVEAVSPQ
jgi:hypothetical protein